MVRLSLLSIKWFKILIVVSAFGVSPILLTLFLYSPEVIQYLVAGDTKDIFLWNVSWVRAMQLIVSSSCSVQ
jgi:hypothetical protein